MYNSVLVLGEQQSYSYTHKLYIYIYTPTGFPGSSDSKESDCNAGDLSSMPGWGRSPEEDNGYSLQYSCLENSMAEEPGGLQSMRFQRDRHD